MSFSNYMQIKIIKNLCLVESAVKTVENACTRLKLCIQVDKTPDSLNIKFHR